LVESLERALNANRGEVERELAKAEEELVLLRARQRRLEDTIRRARLFLGIEPVIGSIYAGDADPQDPVLPLHEALARVLRTQGNRVMTARELADEVNRTGLYRKGDGSPVDIGQIHARVHNYDRLFVRAGGGIRLRETDSLAVDPIVGKRFDAAMLEVYAAAMREVGYPARRFLAMVRGRGGLEAARQLLAKPGISEGFRRLAEARKLDLTMEFLVLTAEFAQLFSDHEREIARERLLGHGMREVDLPR
jgi:HB1, ASXL, restriction endonuclease HTH domain